LSAGAAVQAATNYLTRGRPRVLMKRRDSSAPSLA
jgi:hypothetical protein